MKFRWALGACTGQSKEYVPIAKDTTLKSGDDIKMVVVLMTNCHVYVLHHSSQGDFSLLFPYSLSAASDLHLHTNYYVPKGPPWLRLDNQTGLEKVILLACAERLVNLESLLQKHQGAARGARPALAQAIDNEIQVLRKLHRPSRTLVERPAALGGSLRAPAEGGENGRPDVAMSATEVATADFFSRIYTIEHR